MLVDTWATRPDSRLNVNQVAAQQQMATVWLYFFIIYLSSSAFQNGPETAAHLRGHLLYSSSAWGCSRQACFCPFLPTSSFHPWSAWRPRSCSTRGFSTRFSGLLSAGTYCQPARTGARPSPCPEKPWDGERALSQVPATCSLPLSAPWQIRRGQSWDSKSRLGFQEWPPSPQQRLGGKIRNPPEPLLWRETAPLLIQQWNLVKRTC